MKGLCINCAHKVNFPKKTFSYCNVKLLEYNIDETSCLCLRNCDNCDKFVQDEKDD